MWPKGMPPPRLCLSEWEKSLGRKAQLHPRAAYEARRMAVNFAKLSEMLQRLKP
jgi:hypothetical protein